MFHLKIYIIQACHILVSILYSYVSKQHNVNPLSAHTEIVSMSIKHNENVSL